jgi:hypothetical protein
VKNIYFGETPPVTDMENELREIIPWPDTSDAPPRRKLPEPSKSAGTSTGGNRSMVDFVTLKAGSDPKGQGVDVVMKEDGTMEVAGGEANDEDVLSGRE